MGQHRLYGRLGHQIGGPNIESQHPIERFKIDILDRQRTIHASIIHQNVDLHFAQILDKSGIGHITDHGQDVGVLSRQFLQICTASCYRMHCCPCLCEAKRDGGTQSSTSPCYDGDAP